MVSGATPAFKNIWKYFMNAKERSILCQFDSQQFSSTRTRCFSAVPPLLRGRQSTHKNTRSSPTSSVFDDAFTSFEREGNDASIKQSTTGGSARSSKPTALKPLQRARKSRSMDQNSGFSIDGQALDFRSDIKTAIGSFQNLIGGSAEGFPPSSPGHRLGKHLPTQPRNSRPNIAVNVEDAVWGSSAENIGPIASENSRAPSISKSGSQNERAADRPSVPVEDTHPALVSKRPGRKPSPREITSQSTSDESSKSHNSQPRESWQIQKAALKRKFGETSWQPRKRVSPDAQDGIRALHAQYPDIYTTPVLANKFQISPEAIRRILKSKWRPTEEEAESRRERWAKRGDHIWDRMVELGVVPPKSSRKNASLPQVSAQERTLNNGPGPSRSRPRKSWLKDEGEPKKLPAFEGATLGIAERIL